MDEQLEFVKEIARRLDSAGIPYMLTGSLAMAAYAAPRMTRDIDVVVEISPQDVKRFSQQFLNDCYIEEESVSEAVSRRTMFNVIHNQWIVKADFIVRKNDSYHETEFSRRSNIDIDGVRVAVVTPEDLILSKLLWANETESEMQQRDVVELIRSVGSLDWPYLERWAAALGIADNLRSVRSE